MIDSLVQKEKRVKNCAPPSESSKDSDDNSDFEKSARTKRHQGKQALRQRYFVQRTCSIRSNSHRPLLRTAYSSRRNRAYHQVVKQTKQREKCRSKFFVATQQNQQQSSNGDSPCEQRCLQETSRGTSQPGPPQSSRRGSLARRRRRVRRGRGARGARSLLLQRVHLFRQAANFSSNSTLPRFRARGFLADHLALLHRRHS